MTAVAVLTPAELEAIVRKAVREELAATREPVAASEYMTRAQVAELLGVHEASVTSYAKKRGLLGMKLAGGEWRFRRVDVATWMQTQRKGT